MHKNDEQIASRYFQEIYDDVIARMLLRQSPSRVLIVIKVVTYVISSCMSHSLHLHIIIGVNFKNMTSHKVITNLHYHPADL